MKGKLTKDEQNWFKHKLHIFIQQHDMAPPKELDVFLWVR